jgi:Fe-S oxidoreductase
MRDRDARRLLVADAGCVLPLRNLSPLSLVEHASRHLDKLRPVSTTERLRYHDACALGRGLGLYNEPRRLLEAVSGEPPLEFELNRELARCSGGGGILPVSMPQVASHAARRRVQEHEGLGGGQLVTACASSLSMFRREGGAAVDLMTVVARGLVPDA